MAQGQMTDTGIQLWEYMKQNPMSAHAIGRKIGIRHSTVLRIVRGQTKSTTEVLCKIESFLEKEGWTSLTK